MPPFVIVIGIIALIIGAILALRATLTIEYRDALNVSVKVLFLNFKITPRKEKKVDPKDFTPRKFRRMMKKKRRKELRAYKKKQKKLEKKSLQKKEGKAQKKSGAKKLRSLLDNINTVKELVELVTARFVRHLRIELTRIKIVVATDDAAKTAVLYGVVSQSVAYTLELLDRVTNLEYAQEADVSVDVDFLETKPRADVHIAFSLRVWHLLDIALRALGRFISVKAKKQNK